MTLPAPESSSFLAARRIYGIALRHFYLYKESWPRLIEMLYWPMINMTLFGFVSLATMRRLGHAEVLTEGYLCGVMLCEVFLRTIIAMMITHMEEIWSRNLGHLFASPLRLRDYILALMGLSATRCLAVIPAFFVVYLLFDFSILRLGWALPVYAFLLCFSGWWYGLLILSLLMRFGLAAEWLGWMGSWLIMPFMAPYYPASIMPEAFQLVSKALPGTYVFESMRYQLANGSARADYLGIALALNLLYFGLSTLIFNRAFRSARQSGGLLQMGE